MIQGEINVLYDHLIAISTLNLIQLEKWVLLTHALIEVVFILIKLGIVTILSPDA